MCLRAGLVSTNTLGDLKVPLQPFLKTVVQLKRQAGVGSVTGKVELGTGDVCSQQPQEPHGICYSMDLRCVHLASPVSMASPQICVLLIVL